MSKKKYLFLLSAILLISCQNNSYSKSYLSSSAQSVVPITNQNLNKYCSMNLSFILYVGNNSCSTCSIYKRNLNNLIKEENILVFHLNYSESDNNYLSIEDNLLFPKIEADEAPCLFFILNGNINEYYPYDDSYLNISNLSNIIFSERNFENYLLNNFNEDGSFISKKLSLQKNKYYYFDNYSSPLLSQEVNSYLETHNLAINYYFYHEKSEISENLTLPCLIYYGETIEYLVI